MCLAMRDGHGQVARLATSYDDVIISVLIEAQNRQLTRRRGLPRWRRLRRMLRVWLLRMRRQCRLLRLQRLLTG
jgi:hypothetical protein